LRPQRRNGFPTIWLEFCSGKLSARSWTLVMCGDGIEIIGRWVTLWHQIPDAREKVLCSMRAHTRSRCSRLDNKREEQHPESVRNGREPPISDMEHPTKISAHAQTRGHCCGRHNRRTGGELPPITWQEASPCFNYHGMSIGLVRNHAQKVRRHAAGNSCKQV
jgi:hypothetical protein